MTEQQWLAEQHNPQGMVWHFQTATTRTKAGRRKLRLFACGGCRLFWNQLQDTRLKQAVEIAELFADGLATKQDLESARTDIGPLAASTSDRTDPQQLTAASIIRWVTMSGPREAALALTLYEPPLAGYCGDHAEECRLVCALLRDVFGNPFRPVAFMPEWRTGTAVSLAQQMYESRDFGAMPILADALQDAGCNSDDILNHCRDANQVHVRGCWVVDLVLGKG